MLRKRKERQVETLSVEAISFRVISDLCFVSHEFWLLFDVWQKVFND